MFETIRYLIAGTATTGVNFLIFYLLRNVCSLTLNTSNFIAIFLSILFAYVINKHFVFQTKSKTWLSMMEELMNFFSSRLLTMAIELLGVGILAGILGVQEMLSKLLVQVIVLVLNYILSKCFVFHNKRQKRDSIVKTYQLQIIAFLIPLFVLLICCMIYEVEPFGDHTLVIIDGLHQYMPFFSEYQNKLQHGESLFYSWNSGLGVNFLALWAYYLASPLNLIIVFFPQKYLNGVVSMLIITKIALSSMTMSIYLSKAHWAYKKERTVRKEQWKILLFSMAYAFSSYMIGYSWNVMWLETMILLPLIILGFETLIEKNDGRWYCLALFVSLACNFYMTFMTCLFLVLYFFLYPYKTWKQFIKKGVIFAGYSLLAGAMAAVILLPTYEALMLTLSAKLQFPTPALYGSFFDTLNSHSIGANVITNAQADGKTNLYCGILTIFLCNLYIMNRKLKLSVRIKQTVLILFLLLSFNFNWLNYIWHGFHDQYGIPNRFAYLYIFVMLCMAYQVLVWIKTYRPYQIIWSFGVIIGVLILSSLFSDTQERWYSYLFTGLLAFIYMCILLYYSSWRLPKRCTSLLITSIMVIELTAHTIYGYSCTGQVTVSKFFSTTEDIQQAKKLMEIDTDLYRSELAKSKMLDEVTWHRLKGVGLFGSTAIGDVAYTMGRLGFYSAVNEYLYKGSTPLTDAILGVKYVFVRPGETASSSFSYYKSTDSVDLYRNYDALPIGYIVSEQAKEINYKTNNPFDAQNNWVQATDPDATPVFETVLPEEMVQLNGMTSTYRNGGTVSYDITETRDDNLVYTIVPQKDMDLYVYITGNQIERIQVKAGDAIRCNDKLNSQIVHIGQVNKGEPVTISVRIKNETKTGQIRMMAASFHYGAFQKYVNDMREQPYEIETYTSNTIKGTVDVREDGMLFTSIPYDKGWSISIDGNMLEKEDMIPVADAFIGIPLDKGTHEVILSYIPTGYRLGKTMSILSIGMFVICNGYHRFFKKNKKIKNFFNSLQ